MPFNPGFHFNCSLLYRVNKVRNAGLSYASKGSVGQIFATNLNSFNCRWIYLMLAGQRSHILPECRESARRASCAMGRGAAPGRGRPSDGDEVADLLMAECLRWTFLVINCPPLLDGHVTSSLWPSLACGLLPDHVQGKKAKLHRLFPADAGLGGPPRPGVDPVTPARFTARDPRR